MAIIIITVAGCVTIIKLHNQKYPGSTDSASSTHHESQTAPDTNPEIPSAHTDSQSSSGDQVTTEGTTLTSPDLSAYDNTSSEATVGGSITQSTATEAEATTTEFPDCFDLELELLSQYPELPAGCESVSLTMILNYLGYNLDKTDIVDDYLVYSGNFVMGYSGNPYSYDVGGGIYAPGMTITANSFFEANGNRHYAENVTGTDFDTLLEYVAEGHPVLIWSTISMMSCSKGSYNYDEEGNPYAWDYNEHCVVLTGYDYRANTVTVYDPIEGVVWRDMDEFEAIYNDMNQMAIIIKET